MNLIESTQKYNQVIKNLDVLDQLKAAGNSIQVEDRKTVVDALDKARQDLVLAFKTERILRENPGFNPAEFDVSLTNLEAGTTQVQAKEYARLLNAALQVAVNVQNEIQDLTMNPEEQFSD